MGSGRDAGAFYDPFFKAFLHFHGFIRKWLKHNSRYDPTELFDVSGGERKKFSANGFRHENFIDPISREIWGCKQFHLTSRKFLLPRQNMLRSPWRNLLISNTIKAYPDERAAETFFYAFLTNWSVGRRGWGERGEKLQCSNIMLHKKCIKKMRSLIPNMNEFIKFKLHFYILIVSAQCSLPPLRLLPHRLHFWHSFK